MAGSYGLNRDMELAVVRQVLADPALLPRLERHLRPEGFDDATVRLALQGAVAYLRRAKVAPTAVGLLQEVREGVNRGAHPPEIVREVADLLEDARERPGVESSYVADKILGAERRAAVWSAIERSVKLHQAGDVDGVLREVERASAIGRGDASPGVDYAATLEARTRHRLTYKAPQRWGTGIVEVDDLTRGGLSLENPLGLVIGGMKSGKSMFLDHVALHHVAVGGFPAIFSFENGEREVTDRQDAAISLVPIDQLYLRAAEVEERVADFLRRSGGGMHVKKFPGGAVTSCRDVDAYLENLRAEQSVRPTCIIFDYADEMACNDPTKYERRHEELAAIFREMRALLEKWRCVGWTASQVKADALEKKNPDLGDIAGAIAKAAIVDLVVAICRTQEERVDERVRFFIAASRFSADGQFTAPLPSAYGMGRIVAQSLEPTGPNR